MDYRLFSAGFVADSAITTLRFTEYTNPDYGIVLDAVQVLPEPSSASQSSGCLPRVGGRENIGGQTVTCSVALVDAGGRVAVRSDLLLELRDVIFQA